MAGPLLNITYTKRRKRRVPKHLLDPMRREALYIIFGIDIYDSNDNDFHRNLNLRRKYFH